MMGEINMVAVLVAAVLAMVVGSVWYSQKLFGNAWMKHSGASMGDGKGMGKTYLMAFIGNMVMAYVLALFIGPTGVGVGSVGMAVGFWAWLGFMAPLNYGAVLWERKPIQYFWINTLHNLVVLIVMGFVIASWS